MGCSLGDLDYSTQVCGTCAKKRPDLMLRFPDTRGSLKGKNTKGKGYVFVKRYAADYDSAESINIQEREELGREGGDPY